MRTRYPGPGRLAVHFAARSSPAIATSQPIRHKAGATTSYDALQQRIRDGEKEVARCSAPKRKWTAEQKSSYRCWRNYYYHPWPMPGTTRTPAYSD